MQGALLVKTAPCNGSAGIGASGGRLMPDLRMGHTSVAPASRKARAMPSPTMPVAPVTTATLPSRSMRGEARRRRGGGGAAWMPQDTRHALDCGILQS